MQDAEGANEEESIEEAALQLSLRSEEDEVVYYKLRAAETQIQVRELRSKGLSFQIWPAAHALCWYLEETFGSSGMLSNHTSHLLAPEAPPLRCNLRVLELGAGTGMVGIVCAVLGAHSTITDLPHVLPNLEHNAKLNQDVIKSSGLGGSVVVRMLRWGEQADIEALGCAFDVVVASDVVYYDHLFEPLLCTLKWLLLPPSRAVMEIVGDKADIKTVHRDELCMSSDASQEEGTASYMSTTRETVSMSTLDDANASISEKSSVVDTTLGCRKGATRDDASPTVLLAHLRRWKKDSHFFKKAAKLFQVAVVHKHPHDANSRTGVTVYSFSRKKG